MERIRLSSKYGSLFHLALADKAAIGSECRDRPKVARQNRAMPWGCICSARPTRRNQEHQHRSQFLLEQCTPIFCPTHFFGRENPDYSRLIRSPESTDK